MASPAASPELVGGSFWRNTAAALMPETSPASVGRHPTVPLLGRERERAQVRAAAALVETSASSRIVTLLGEGGIGKTRLLRQLERELVDNGYRVWSASAPSLPLSFGLFGRLLRARFQLADSASGTSSADAVRRIVAEVVEPGQVADVCYLLGPLIELPFEQTALTRAVAEDAQQAHLLRRTLIRRFFEADAAATPICLSLDDLQSADADSIELLGYLSENLAAPVLLLCSARPELLKRYPEWLELGRGRHERIDVGPLLEPDALALMRALLAPCVGGPPEPLVEAAVGTARGNPGLLAQMLQIFHDSGVLAAASDSGWTVHLDKLASARLPLTADDAVTARIAALSANERKLLEHAAVMGSVFWLGGLVALGRVDRDPPELWTEEASSDVEALRRTLEDLMRRDYVLELPDSSFPD
ncbi:MAG TPA: AAA family ATPase, partial [Polyangiaceae bacterium]|nr:AAA family ATPase [Polyangiaceae bacterium]